MRIYISGPLQGSPDLRAARSLYDSIAALVARHGHVPYVPHHNTDPDRDAELSARAVFATDLAALESCGGVIAHIGVASTGVGAEIAIALASGRPVLGVKRPGERSSRFAEGLLAESGCRVAEFGDTYELDRLIQRWLSETRDAHGRVRTPHGGQWLAAIPA